MKKVLVTEAVGMALCHDITQIVPGQEKKRAFKKGHVIREEDVSTLLDLGKRHIYIWEPEPGEVHEDDAALLLARVASGEGLVWSEPNQGKVTISSLRDGLLRVLSGKLYNINSLPGISFATLHNNRRVLKDQTVAGTRVIPLTIQQEILDQAEEYSKGLPVISVKAFSPLWVGVITSGTEVYEGRIKDGFFPVIKKKIASFGGRLLAQVIVPDNSKIIAEEIHRMIAQGAQLVLVTGGMSVDPDDVTPKGIRQSGAREVFYGSPVIPGSMIMLSYLGNIPVCGLPGCVMYNRNTVFDLLLPRFFAEDQVNREDIVAMGHGGLCQECEVCHYPDCAFGKNI
jgi:molybdenum cofactor synthesis domain-containing protein